jgi:hypothetical protein
MLEKIQKFIISNWEYLIWLLNINEQHIKELAIDWAKAFFVILVWFIISKIVYTYTIKIFKRYKLKEKINKFEEFLEKDEEIKEGIKEEKPKKKLTERIKIDIVAAKSFSYYIFLFFFKQSLLVLNITEVASSLDTLLNYLPSLFVWIIIWFFGIRFANFIYDVTYHTLSIAESKSKTKTSKIIATGSKWLILFLTFTLVLNFTKIIDKEMIYIILIGFISMTSLAWWLAFWLWWKHIARSILEKFNKEE